MRDIGSPVLEIRSVQNPSFKRWTRLLTPKGRKKEGRFLVETRKMIGEAVRSGLTPQTLICLESEKEDGWCGQKASDDSFIEAFPQIARIPETMFRSLTTMETPDGWLAVFQQPEYAEHEAEEWTGRILILDHIQDPGNLGAMLRSAEAFGFRRVIGVDTVDFWNPKVLRGSMGSVFRLDLSPMHVDAFLSLMQKRGTFPVLGADLAGTDLRSFAWPASFGLIIGNEGRGLRPEMDACLDQRITIPMQGKTESLNAAVSASLLMAFAALEGAENLR